MSVSRGGELSFVGRLVGRDGSVTQFNDKGIWSEHDGKLRLLVRTGDQAPGIAEGAVLKNFNQLVRDSAGQLSFNGTLMVGPGGVSSANATGTWQIDGANVVLVSREGEVLRQPRQDRLPAAGAEATGFPSSNKSTPYFVEVESPTFNRAGDFVVSATIGFKAVPGAQKPPAADSLQRTPVQCLWLGSKDGLLPVAWEGMAAPGAADGNVFREINSVQLNGSGDLLFTAILSGGDAIPKNCISVWQSTGGKLKMVARAMNQAPGTPKGALFESFTRAYLSNSGQVAVCATLLPGPADVGSGNRVGIWATSQDGELRLIARQGEAFKTRGASGTFMGLAMDGECLNAGGQLVFTATSPSETIAFISDLVAGN
jgi:hypothetical protein